jgi:hypothetical protein
MKKKLLVISMALLACSFSSAEASIESIETELDGFVDAYANLDWSAWNVTGASEYEGDFYFNQSSARTAGVWDITTQPEAIPEVAYNYDSTIKESTIPVGDYVAAEAAGETGIDDFGEKIITSQSTVRLMPSTYGSYSAESGALRGQSYEVLTANTTVTFTIPYVLDVVYGDTYGDNDKYGVGMAWVHLRQFDQTAGKWSEDVLAKVTLIQEGVGYQKNTLSLSYTIDSINPQGTYILFEAGVDTRAAILNPVPVPPSVLMLLTGCTSLFFMRRRKN